MPIKPISELSIGGRRLFVRVDFNVPLTPAGGVADDTRIRESLPTIKHAIEQGARVVLASHLGRPKGKPDPKYSLEPVAARLAELLGVEVVLTDEPVGDGARKVVADLRDGDVALLENLRFHPGEEANDESFARALASYADVYVNDAFGTAHRAHASTAGMIKFVAEKGDGPPDGARGEVPRQLLGDVERPFVAVIGGAKVSDKIGVLDNLLARVDPILIGGAMANTFLKAKGGHIGTLAGRGGQAARSRARSCARPSEAQVDVLLPRDVVAAAGHQGGRGPRGARRWRCRRISRRSTSGPRRRAASPTRSRARKTIFWNGPMGVFEKEPFAAGTLAVAKAVAAAKALTVVGGGDSVAAVDKPASPTRSPTSRPAAAPRSSSSRARSCPASPRWKAESITPWPTSKANAARSSAATGS